MLLLPFRSALLLLFCASASVAGGAESDPASYDESDSASYSYDESDSEYSSYDEYASDDDTQCAPGCQSHWLNDGVCDAPCNVAICKYDELDCYHDAPECFEELDGSDYRGRVSVTVGGRQCQAWSAQSPNHHFKTTMNYPAAGLGGHNFCRNPDGEPRPWCFTLDYPNVRWEYCDVGSARDCGNETKSWAWSGGKIAPGSANNPGGRYGWSREVGEVEDLSVGEPVEDTLKETEQLYYKVTLPAAMAGVKVVVVSMSGDADLFVSFDTAKPDRRQATWVVESVGVKKFVLPRSNHLFCGAQGRLSSGTRGSASGGPTCAGASEGEVVPCGSQECTLYLTVSGYDKGQFRLTVYNFRNSDSESAVTGEQGEAWSCSPGCDEVALGDAHCNPPCNTSACLWDSGDCGYFGEFEMEGVCSSGCVFSWLGDGYCDEACFNAACDWDDKDCISTGDGGCADGCLPTWIDDKECDARCNNEACGYDGTDCDHGEDECYMQPAGSDYRGSASTTQSGLKCQPWSEQWPHQHTHTHAVFPNAGLGGHNSCRNPIGPGEPGEDGPWCYTMDPAVRSERCAVPPTRAGQSCAPRASARADVYHKMCPVDCSALLGNGICDARCNISSCVYDSGDCGVGVDVVSILAEQGYRPVTQLGEYILVGGGVLTGITIGLLVLRHVLLRLRAAELRRRGYTADEMKGMDLPGTHDEPI